MSKEVKEIIRELKDRGWVYDKKTGTGHVKMNYIPGGSITFASTPSDKRYFFKNVMGDAQRIERIYGPYKPPPKPENNVFNGKYGLDYIKEEPMSTVISYKKLPEPKATPLEQKAITRDIPNKDLVVSLLKKRRDELFEKVGPYRDLVIELDQLEESLINLTGEATLTWKGTDLTEAKTNEDKVKKFLEKPNPPAVKKRYKTDEVYRMMKEVIKANNNEMTIPELCTWMTEVHGIEASTSQTVAAKLMAYIQVYNKENPGRGTLSLFPDKDPLAGRAKAYTHIKNREEFNS